MNGLPDLYLSIVIGLLCWTKIGQNKQHVQHKVVHLCTWDQPTLRQRFMWLNHWTYDSVLEIQVKRGSEPSADHYLAVRLDQIAREAAGHTWQTQMCREGELGNTGGGPCQSGLQLPSLEEFLVHLVQVWDMVLKSAMVKASIVEVAAKSCG